jgi:hypothetical protein
MAAEHTESTGQVEHQRAIPAGGEIRHELHVFTLEE